MRTGGPASGSSPLARGLRGARGTGGGRRRIIPARAGFTSTRPALPCGSPDHPRSRGVYAGRGGRAAGDGGSSPLARGLQWALAVTGPARGIIPARAGFTGTGSDRGDGGQDHPRSRGVYTDAPGRLAPRCGSSPLARGLLRGQAGGRSASGIIPARAGFTVDAHWAVVRTEDHPRSRGVYYSAAALGTLLAGSSPLARGLPCRRSYLGSPPRIIPARAGFTLREDVGGRRRRGSSPLARGLRLRQGRHGRALGIIPARAGFTFVLLHDDPLGGDHPRSRGVYVGHKSPQAPWEGSSPLARGLPGRHLQGETAPGSSPLARGLQPALARRLGGPRIIPARAGFTRGAHAAARCAQDHPRSRGVYSFALRFEHVCEGSSPLARGLRRRASAASMVSGIIPARAGFTPGSSSALSCGRDHPRSRGVYMKPMRVAMRALGSSPLARGLPRASGQKPGRRGIIPARAGFTAAFDGCYWDAGDHPRSRGVYLTWSA